MVIKLSVSDTGAKKWYQSKTLQVSILATIVGILTVVQGQVEAGTSITVMGVTMGYLRTLTSTKIE